MRARDVAKTGFALRPTRRDDLAAVVSLMRACDEVEFGRPDTDDADVLSEWDCTGFSLARDALLVVETDRHVRPFAGADPQVRADTDDEGARTPEGVVGYAQVFEGQAQVVVHPRRNGRGIGTALRRFTEERALQQAGEGATRSSTEARAPAQDKARAREVKIWQAPRRGNLAAHRLLEAAGYTRGHHYAQMECELRSAPSAPVWPDGFTVRPFEPGQDEIDCHHLHNRAWSQYETFEPVSFERWTDMTREPDFDPSLWFVAQRHDEIVGMCLCRTYGEIGWVTSLVVHPDARGRGLGEALLGHAFIRLHARGVRLVGLSVSSRTTKSAWRLYERAGMRDSGGWVAYEKVLRPAGRD